MAAPTSEPRGSVVLATHNPGKLDELRRLCARHGVRVVTAPELGLAIPEEDGLSYADNARKKAVAAFRATGRPSLGDDAGFEIEAFEGRPGTETRAFVERLGGYPRAMARLRDVLSLGAPEKSPPVAALACALVLVWGPHATDVAVAQVRVRGTLHWPPDAGLPGFAALLRTPDAPLFEGDVLRSRALAFTRLLDALRDRGLRLGAL